MTPSKISSRLAPCRCDHHDSGGSGSRSGSRSGRCWPGWVSAAARPRRARPSRRWHQGSLGVGVRAAGHGPGRREPDRLGSGRAAVERGVPAGSVHVPGRCDGHRGGAHHYGRAWLRGAARW